MNKSFRELRIVGVRKEESFVVKGNVVRIYLRLDGNPPLGWSYTFSQVWQTVSYAQKAPAGADGDSVWVDCVPNELRPVHFAELERAVAATNVRYLEWQQQKEAAQSKLEGFDSETRSQLVELGKSFEATPPSVTVVKSRSRIAMWLGIFCIYWILTGIVVLWWIANKGERTVNQMPVLITWLVVLIACGLAAYADFRRGIKARGKHNQVRPQQAAETTP